MIFHLVLHSFELYVEFSDVGTLVDSIQLAVWAYLAFKMAGAIGALPRWGGKGRKR